MRLASLFIALLTVSAMGQTTSYFYRCNTTTCSGELLPYAPAPVNDDAAALAAWIEQQHVEWAERQLIIMHERSHAVSTTTRRQK